MKLSTKLKTIATSLVLSSTLYTSTAVADSSVWKVSKGDDYIYLGGTVHILPITEFPLPEEFDIAYKDSDSVVLEAELPDPTDQQAQMAMMQKMSFKGGKTISDVISEDTYKKLEEYLAASGVNLSELKGFKPGFIVVMMAMIEAQKAQIAGEGVDSYFSKMAKKDNKAAEYLETLDFQAELLANMGVGHENEFINSSMDQMSKFKEMLVKTIAAWRIGDEKVINEVMIKPVIKEDPKTFNSMFSARNKNWIPHIDKMFTDKDREFVLVGVGHLVGQDSVIELLKTNGYKVTKI